MGEGRLRGLDGLRGLAALIVVAFHVLHFTGQPHWLTVIPLSVLLAGPQAVVVFFVLSGFVLARPYAARRAPAYGTFLLRRALRLWPACGAALILAALLRHASPIWTGQLVALSGAMLLTGAHILTMLDPPMWSLVQETRASLIFPLIARTARSTPACIVAAALWLTARILLPDTAGTSLYLMLPAFILGARLAQRHHTHRSPWVLVPAGLAGLYLAQLVAGGWADRWATTLMLPVTVLAAGALVTAARRPGTWLERRVPQYLGRISYSLYLVHYPIMLAVANHRPWLIPLAVAASVLTADVMQRLVEAPAVRLGRRRAPALAAA